MIRRATRRRRQNLGLVFARLAGAGTILLGLLVAVSVVAPSFQASDLIKVLGIGGVATRQLRRNRGRNSNPSDHHQDDERRVVIPNADLFTHSVIVNTAADIRRWEYDFAVKGNFDLSEVKSGIVDAVRKVPGTLPEPSP
jgi:small conductance mechanosensitive channel